MKNTIHVVAWIECASQSVLQPPLNRTLKHKNENKNFALLIITKYIVNKFIGRKIVFERAEGRGGEMAGEAPALVPWGRFRFPLQETF